MLSFEGNCCLIFIDQEFKAERIMKTVRNQLVFVALACTIVCCYSANAQNKSGFEVLNDKDAAVVIPASFYFAGQSAPTQMRNAAAARLGKDRFIIIGLVDTSGYSTEISGKYEGFFITDSTVKVGNRMLGTGAYGFGFSKDGKVNIFDISGKQILSVAVQNDQEIKRPRPLQLMSDGRGVRFYRGKSFIVVSSR
jgi:hypothetical protein